jgi:ribose transport system permease protein
MAAPSSVPALPSHVETVDVANRRELSLSQRLLGSTAFWMGAILVALVLGFGIASPDWAMLQFSNFQSMALSVSMIMLLAVGMTFVLGAGELDLSIGANVMLSSVVAAKVMAAVSGSAAEIQAGIYPNLAVGVLAGVLAGIGTGALFGLVNGLLATRLRISSFIVTLGTTGIGTGLAFVLSGGVNVPFVPRDIQTGFGALQLGGVVPLPTVLVVGISLVLWYVLVSTRFGLHTLAIGSSREAAGRAGINVPRHVLSLFVLMGAFAGLAGILDLSRFATTNVGGYQTTAMGAIAAVVIGGTSLFGGRASVGGSMVGALIPLVLATGLVIVDVDSFYQLIVVGMILVIAVYLDQRRRERLE